MSSTESSAGSKQSPDKSRLEILTFPLSSLLKHVNISATLENSHDLLLCKELVDKVGAHLCSKLGASSATEIQTVQLEVPMFKVGTLDSLLGDGGMEQLERCLAASCQMLSNLMESYQELTRKSKKDQNSFTLVPSSTLLQNAMENLTKTSQHRSQSGIGRGYKCNSWNYAKYSSEGTLADVVSQFEKGLQEIEQIVRTKREQFLEAHKQMAKQAPVQAAIEGLSRECSVKALQVLNESHIDDLLASDLFRSALILGEEQQIMRLCKQTDYVAQGPPLLENPPLQMVTVLQSKASEFQQFMQQEESSFQWIDQQLLDAIKSRSLSTSSLDFEGTSLASDRSLYVQSLVVGITASLECKLHLTLVKCYYEAVLEFGLPPVFVSILVSIPHARQKSDLGKFYRKFVGILSKEFMVQHSESRPSYSQTLFVL